MYVWRHARSKPCRLKGVRDSIMCTGGSLELSHSSPNSASAAASRPLRGVCNTPRSPTVNRRQARIAESSEAIPLQANPYALKSVIVPTRPSRAAWQSRRVHTPTRAIEGVSACPTNGQYDVIIIGSGAGGGTLARQLAPTGKRILILERGGWLPRELENWDAEEVFVKNRYVPTETWYDKNNKAFHPGVHYWVGGATKLYGAALYRLRKEDFGELKHHDGVSPAWPISYEEMEPYYTQAEQMYQVHGARGEDPTEPPASAPYPFPALSHEPRIQQLHDDLAQRRLSPVPLAQRHHAQ